MHERQLKTQEKIIFQYHSGISGRVLVTVYLIEKLFREILKNRNTYVKLRSGAERRGARGGKKMREGTLRLETFSSMQRTESF